MILVVYQSESDPIVKCLKNSNLLQSNDIVFLTAKQILDEVTIYDQVVDGVASISWTLNDGRILRNSEDVLLVNRLMYLDDKLFEDFHPDDKEYAKQEFWAYLTFALSAFPRCTATPNFLGLAGATAPLPMQWQEVRQVAPDVPVPQFYLGTFEHYESVGSDEETVFSEPYNFYKWKANASETKTVLKPENFVFSFKRPKGRPISAFVAGESSFTLSADGKEVDGASKSRIGAAMEKLQKIFNLTIGEYLLFDDGVHVSFGMCQANVSDRIVRDPRFSGSLLSGIQGL